MELMHLTDCHEVSAIVYGGVLGLILEERHLGRTQSDGLTFVKRVYVDAVCGTSRDEWLPRLRRNNLLNDGWWELSRQVSKAAAKRSAAPLIAELANAALVGDNPEPHKRDDLLNHSTPSTLQSTRLPCSRRTRTSTGQSDHQRVRRSDHTLAGGQHASQQVVLQDHTQSTQADARTNDEPAVAASVPGGRPDRVSHQDLATGGEGAL